MMRDSDYLERFPESNFKWRRLMLPLVVLLLLFVLVLLAQPSRRGGGCSGGGGASYLDDHGSDACAQNQVWVGNGAP